MIEALRHFSKIIPRWSDKLSIRADPLAEEDREQSIIIPRSSSLEEVTSRTIPRFQPRIYTHAHRRRRCIHRLDRTYISILSWARNCRRAFVSCHWHWLKQGRVSRSTLITPSPPDLQPPPSRSLNNTICACFVGQRRHHDYFLTRREIRPPVTGHPIAYGDLIEFF